MSPIRRLAFICLTLLLVWGSLAPALGTTSVNGRARFLVAKVLADPTREQRGGRGGEKLSLVQRFPWLIPRATRDRPEGRRGSLVHVIYLVPSDAPGRPLDRLGIIEDSVRAWNTWMEQESGYRWRVDRFTFPAPQPGGGARQVSAIDVTYVKADRATSEIASLADVRTELVDRGFDDEGKRYLVYAATNAGAVCGEAEYPVSTSPDITGQYAVVFLDSDPACRGRDFAAAPNSPSWTEATAVHELIHNDGVVQPLAPHDCRPTSVGHVCTPLLVLVGFDPETNDLMFPYITGPLPDKVLDRGHDDYFGHPFSYRDLTESPYLKSVG